MTEELRRLHSCLDNEGPTCKREQCDEMEFDPRSFCHSLCGKPEHICRRTVCQLFKREEKGYSVCAPTMSCKMKRNFASDSDQQSISQKYDGTRRDEPEPTDSSHKMTIDIDRKIVSASARKEKMTEEELMNRVKEILRPEQIIELTALSGAERCSCCNCVICRCNLLQVKQEEPVSHEKIKKKSPTKADPKKFIPVEETSKFVRGRSAPIEEKSLPVEERLKLGKKKLGTVKEKLPSVKERLAPMKGRLAPEEERLAPLKKKLAPMKEKLAPVEERLAPVEGRLEPAKERLPPVEERLAPLEESSPSVEGKFSIEKEITSIEKDFAPIKEEIVSVEKELVPVEEKSPFVEEELVPSKDESPSLAEMVKDAASATDIVTDKDENEQLSKKTSPKVQSEQSEVSSQSDEHKDMLEDESMQRTQGKKKFSYAFDYFQTPSLEKIEIRDEGMTIDEKGIKREGQDEDEKKEEIPVMDDEHHTRTSSKTEDPASGMMVQSKLRDVEQESHPYVFYEDQVQEKELMKDKAGESEGVRQQNIPPKEKVSAGHQLESLFQSITKPDSTPFQPGANETLPITTAAVLKEQPMETWLKSEERKSIDSWIESRATARTHKTLAKEAVTESKPVSKKRKSFAKEKLWKVDTLEMKDHEEFDDLWERRVRDVCECLPGYCICGSTHYTYKKQKGEIMDDFGMGFKYDQMDQMDPNMEEMESDGSSCSCVHAVVDDDFKLTPVISKTQFVPHPPTPVEHNIKLLCKIPKYQVSVLIIKPEAVKFKDVILRAIKKEGLDLINERYIQLTPEQAAEIYSENYGSSYFALFIKQMSANPILVLSIAGMNAIQRWNELIGRHKSISTSWFYPNSIRRRFGIHEDVLDAMKFSDDFKKAPTEMRYFFPLNIIDPIIISSMEVQDYCDKNIHPTLLRGLLQLVLEKPDDPLSFLAEWLLVNNPFQPFYKQIHVALASI